MQTFGVGVERVKMEEYSEKGPGVQMLIKCARIWGQP